MFFWLIIKENSSQKHKIERYSNYFILNLKLINKQKSMEDRHLQQNDIQELKLGREIFRMKQRKKIIKQKLMQSRLSSNQNLSIMKEEENEELSMPKEMHLQLNQFHRIHHPKKRGKRCWLC